MTLIISLPALISLTGCSGGVAGEGTNTYSQTGGTTIVRGNAFNDQGWDLISKGQYESAISKFNSVLNDNPTDEEYAEANNGLGWARAKLGCLADGMTWFDKATALSDDAKIGLASGYIQKGSRSDLEKARDLIYTQLGKGNAHFRYVPRRDIGVSDAEVHAMLAYVFAALGQNDDASDQIEYAKELDPNWEGTTIEQLDQIVEFLLR